MRPPCLACFRRSTIFQFRSVGGPQAVAAAKALIQAFWGRPVDDASSVTTKALAARRVSPEGQEGLNAFLGKRKPSWGVGLCVASWSPTAAKLHCGSFALAGSSP